MKISVSLPDEDLAFIDAQAENGRFSSRSAVVHAAVRLLREREYVDSYALAWDEWEQSGDADEWDATASDGLRA